MLFYALVAAKQLEEEGIQSEVINIASIKPLDVTAVIDSVKKTEASKNFPDDKIVYIRLSQFGDSTNDEWLKLANDAATRLNTEKGIKGMNERCRTNLVNKSNLLP